MAVTRVLTATAVPGAKLRPPRVRHTELTRDRLLDSEELGSAEVVAVCAPAGFGKSTLAIQWASRSDVPVVWLTCDETESDPLILITSLTAALAHAVPGYSPPMGPVTAEEPGFTRSVAPAFLRSVEACNGPLRVVLDDLHHVEGEPAGRVLKAFVDSLPVGSQIALVGRSLSVAPLPLWRGQGRVLDIAAGDLALNEDETREAIEDFTTAPVDQAEAGRIHEETTGWPVAVYLLSQSPRAATPSPSTRIEEFIEAEILEPMDPDLRAFVLEIASVGPVNTDMAMTVTGSPDTAHYLGEAITTVLMQTDEQGWHRFHPLLQQCATDVMARENPHRLQHVRAAAARWHVEHGHIEAAVRLALDSEDWPTMGRVIWPSSRISLLLGRTDAVRGWLNHAGEHATEEVAELSMAAAWTAMASSDYGNVLRYAEQTERCMPPDWLDHLASSNVAQHLALLIATTRQGLPASHTAASLAQAVVDVIDPVDPIRGLCLTIWGLNLASVGDPRAQGVMEQASAVAAASHIASSQVEALSVLGLLHMSLGDDTAGCRAIEEAIEVYAFNDLQRMAATSGVLTLARVALAGFRGQSQLDELIARHEAVREQLSPLLPWYRSLSGAVLAFVSVGRGDLSRYREYLSWCSGDADDALCRNWGARAQQAYAAASPLQSLSPAELRVWELLKGRQTLSEIASTLFLSRETVKSHTVSIYRKLGTSSRREAQELAETWG